MLGLANGITNTSRQWQPNFVSGGVLKMWLRNGVGVRGSQWDDSSGNQNHAVQTGVGDQATVSGGGLEFDGSSEHYDIDDITCEAGEGFTVSMVIEPDAVDNRTLLGIGGTSEFLEIMTSRKIRIKIDGDTDTIAFDTNQFIVDEKFILTIVRLEGGTGNLFAYKNGNRLTATSQEANAGEIVFSTLGTRNADRFYDGHIYEALVYDGGDISASDLDKIHNYLKNKHNI